VATRVDVAGGDEIYLAPYGKSREPE
jgi:hypothetical protein